VKSCSAGDALRGVPGRSESGTLLKEPEPGRELPRSGDRDGTGESRLPPGRSESGRTISPGRRGGAAPGGNGMATDLSPS